MSNYGRLLTNSGTAGGLDALREAAVLCIHYFRKMSILRSILIIKHS